MNHNATIFLIDDDPAVRDSLVLLLEEADFSVLAFESAEAFLAVCPSTPRCCAIIDIRMPGLDGMKLQAELVKQGMVLPIIFLTGHGNIPMSVQAIKTGAVDFLTKPVSRAALLVSVEAALLECDRLQMQTQANQKATQCIATLTEREREVLALAITGLANKEIARNLNISHRTIEIHKARIMQKTGANTLLDLVRIAKEGGLYS